MKDEWREPLSPTFVLHLCRKVLDPTKVEDKGGRQRFAPFILDPSSAQQRLRMLPGRLGLAA